MLLINNRIYWSLLSLFLDSEYGQYGGAGGGGYGSYGSYDQAAAGYGTPGVSAPSGGWGGQSQPGAPYSSYGTNDAQPGYNPQPTGASAPVTAYPQGIFYHSLWQLVWILTHFGYRKQ